MAIKSLKDEFFSALQASKSYNLLSPEEQSALKEAFANATDEQLTRGLEELKKDAENAVKLEAEMKAREERQVKLAAEIKQTLKEIEKAELSENAAKDAAQSQKAADKLLAKIEKMPEEEPKKKKFLGIF